MRQNAASRFNALAGARRKTAFYNLGIGTIMPITRSFQQDLEVEQHAAHTARVRALIAFAQDCINGRVQICRPASTTDTPDVYADVVATAYDWDALSIASEPELRLLKRITRDEFLTWKRTTLAAQRETAQRLHNPMGIR